MTRCKIERMTLCLILPYLVNMQTFIYTRLIYTFLEEMVIIWNTIKTVLVPIFDRQCTVYSPKFQYFWGPRHFWVFNLSQVCVQYRTKCTIHTSLASQVAILTHFLFSNKSLTLQKQSCKINQNGSISKIINLDILEK